MTSGTNLIINHNCSLSWYLSSFSFSQFSGPRPWYFLLHKPNEFEDEIGCPLSIFARPEGNTSLITNNVFVIRLVYNINYLLPEIWGGKSR